jgi:hypothetical protein
MRAGTRCAGAGTDRAIPHRAPSAARNRRAPVPRPCRRFREGDGSPSRERRVPLSMDEVCGRYAGVRHPCTYPGHPSLRCIRQQDREGNRLGRRGHRPGRGAEVRSRSYFRGRLRTLLVRPEDAPAWVLMSLGNDNQTLERLCTQS